MAQSKGKIVSLVPQILNDVHYTFQMRGKQHWGFIVEMDNGDKGRASSQRSEFRFKEGDEVYYEYVKDEQHGDRLQSFDAVTPAQKPQETAIEAKSGEGLGRYIADPHKQSLIVAQSCVHYAVMLATAQEKPMKSKEVLLVATEFEKWIHNYPDRTKQ